MQLLLTFSCMIATALSATAHEPDHHGHKEPKVAIDGYVNGYYTFLGRQFSVFLDKAHTAFNGIETANHQTGIHSIYPHIDPHSEAIDEGSLLTSDQQDGISKESAAFVHHQESLNHNSQVLNYILGSSGSNREVFGHGQIHQNPIAKKNAGDAFHVDNNHAGEVMENEKLGPIRNMGRMNFLPTKIYSETRSPILAVTGLRGYPRGGYSQNNKQAFGTPTGMNQYVVEGALTKQEAGGIYSSIGLDKNSYTRSQNSLISEPKYGDFSELNKANFVGRIATQKEKETVMPYPKFGSVDQESNFNSVLNGNQVFPRNQYITSPSYKDSLQIRSVNEASEAAVTQKQVKNTFVDFPTNTNQLGYVSDRLHGNIGLKNHLGQANSAMNLNSNAENIEGVFQYTGEVFEKEKVLTLSNAGNENTFRTKANFRSTSITEKRPFDTSYYSRTDFLRDRGITYQNLHPSGSGIRAPVNTNAGALAQKETKKLIVAHPNFNQIDQTGYPFLFLNENQDIVDHNVYLDHDYRFLLDMNQFNNTKEAMIQQKTEGTFIPFPNNDSPMDFPKTDMQNRILYVDEADYNKASKVLDHGNSYPNAGLRVNGIFNKNVYFGNTGYGRDEINNKKGTINQKENQESLISNFKLNGVAKTDSKQGNTNQHLYISRNGYDGNTQTGQINLEESEFPDKEVDEVNPANEEIEDCLSSCELNHDHIMNPSDDNSGNIVGKVGQEKMTLNPIVIENIKEVFRDRKPHQEGAVQESLGLQTNYGGVDQIKYPSQINDQNVYRNGEELGSSSEKDYDGERQIDSERSVSPLLGIPNTLREYETMGGLILNQKINNQNLYIEGSSVPSEIRLFRPEESAKTQNGIEISDIDNTVYVVNQVDSEGGPFFKRQTRISNSDVVKIGRISDNLGLNRYTDQNQYTDQTSYETLPKSNQDSTGGDTNQEKTGKSNISYFNYDRIGKIGTGSGGYGVFTSNIGNGQFPIHGLHPGYDPLSDSNKGMFLQSGLYGRYPIQDQYPSQIAPRGTLRYPFDYRPTGKYYQQLGSTNHYQEQSGPTARYPLQDGVSRQYPLQGSPLQSGLNIQYPSQRRPSSSYNPQGNVISQVGFNGQYHQQGQYSQQDIQYPSPGGLNVQYSLLHGQYGQNPIENERYLNSIQNRKVLEINRGLTSLSSRLKEGGSYNNSSIENVKPVIKVADKENSETKTQISDAKPESSNDHEEAKPKIDDNTTGISGVTSEKNISLNLHVPSVPQKKADETPQSTDENLKFQTKETTQVGDSQTIKFTLRLPPKITRKTITNQILDETHTMKTQQPEETKGIQMMIDSPSFDSNRGGGGSHGIDLTSRIVTDESSKLVYPSQSNAHIIIENLNSSGSTVGLGDRTELDRYNGLNVQMTNFTSDHSEKIKSDLVMPPTNEQIESHKDQVNPKHFSDYPTNMHANNETRGIIFDSALKLNESNQNQRPLGSSADNEVKLNSHNEDLVETEVTKDNNKPAGVKTIDEGSNGISKDNVLNLHYSENDEHPGGIDEHLRTSDEHRGVQVPDGGFNGLSTSNQLLDPNRANGRVPENIIGLSRGNIDSGVGPNSILGNRNDNGSNVYANGNSNSWKNYQINGRLGDQSRNVEKVELGHHGHFHPILDHARNLL